MHIVCTRLSYPFCFMISQPCRSTPFLLVTFSPTSCARNRSAVCKEHTFHHPSDDTIIYFDNYTTAEQLKTLSQALVANQEALLLDETLWKARKVFKSSRALEGAHEF